MKKKTLLLALLALSSAWPVRALAAADTPRRYAAVAPVAPAPGGEGLQSLALPWPVLQASRSAGLADVRLFDARGQVLPMAWAGPPAAPEITRQLEVPRFAWPAAPAAAQSDLQLRLGPGGAVLSVVDSARPRPAAEGAERWLLDISALRLAEGERLSGIALDWPRLLPGLSTAVSVESSRDGQQWQLVTQAQLLALNAEGQSLELKRIDWPGTTDTPRYLRLSFGRPLPLSASRVLTSRAGAAPPLQTLAVRFEAEGGLLDLQGPLAPRSLALHLPERNSMRPLRLEQRNKESEAWRPVSQFVAWRLQREGRESESPPLQLPPQTAPARYWRLVDAGTTVTRAVGALEATLQWQAPVLVFVAPGDGGLQLAVGREQAPPAAQPLASLIPGYRSGAEQALPRASLGALAPQPEPGWRERVRNAEPEDQRRWLLWAVLVLAVAGLGGLSWRLLRQIAPPQK